MMRRAQGISVNIIIIAALALLVLVILAVLLSRGGRDLSRGVQSCTVQGGQCFSSTDPNRPLNNDPQWEYAGHLDATCGDGELCFLYRYG